ncbi:GAF domain-like protein [Pleurotus eryngii]|uniref:GAF domain-like protein n=1 Tax=Pleurotus eryngii TaxID=5323 RepID=A0A9P5ZQM8_PLEER|nr:GAF domain-like protein [Pleurotus eryngii]
MPHADSALVPKGLQTKAEFWRTAYSQLQGLLHDQRNWVSNLSNSASLIYNALGDSPLHDPKTTNWVGFYIRSSLFPVPRLSPSTVPTDDVQNHDEMLLLGPFCGRPACQSINISPGKRRGVCADAFIKKQSVLVPDVEAYPGHIACDGETKSEIVVPLILLLDDGQSRVVGVFDLDNTALSGFDEEDQRGLEKIANLVVNSSDW